MRNPQNVILARQFTNHFDGFSIGSNDLTQFTLGVDRDASGELADLFDEQDEAVKWMIATVIDDRTEKKKIGLCGEAPSNHPEFARFLVNTGISSISVSPDSFLEVKKHVIAAEEGKSYEKEDIEGKRAENGAENRVEKSKKW